MEFFSGSAPELVSNKLLKEIDKGLRVPNNTVIDSKMSIASFYIDYIQPNLFPIIVLSIVGIYLIIKYVLKQDTDEKRYRKRLHERIIRATQTPRPKQVVPYSTDDLPIQENSRFVRAKDVLETVDITDIADDNNNDYDYENPYLNNQQEYIANALMYGQNNNGRQSLDALAKMMFN